MKACQKKVNFSCFQSLGLPLEEEEKSFIRVHAKKNLTGHIWCGAGLMTIF